MGRGTYLPIQPGYKKVMYVVEPKMLTVKVFDDLDIEWHLTVLKYGGGRHHGYGQWVCFILAVV